MENMSNMLRWEVLRQLVSVAVGWIPTILLIVGIYYVIQYLFDLTVEKRVSKVYEGVRDALGIKEKSDYGRGYHWLRSLCFAVIFMSIGSYLGYYLNAMYVSGEISLIITVGRVTSFYRLFLWLVEGSLFALSAGILLSTVTRIRSISTGEYVKSSAYRFSNGMLKGIRFVGILLAIVVPVASVVFTYIGLMGQ